LIRCVRRHLCAGCGPATCPRERPILCSLGQRLAPSRGATAAQPRPRRLAQARRRRLLLPHTQSQDRDLQQSLILLYHAPCLASQASAPAAPRVPFWLRSAENPQDGGSITAGNSSPLSDGACALVIASAEHARRDGLPALAVVRGYGDANQQPEWFTTAPAAAIPKVNRVCMPQGLMVCRKALGPSSASGSPAIRSCSHSCCHTRPAPPVCPHPLPELPRGPGRRRSSRIARPPSAARRGAAQIIPPRRRWRAQGCGRSRWIIGRSTRWVAWALSFLSI
jgi:hypothetical protein